MFFVFVCLMLRFRISPSTRPFVFQMSRLSPTFTMLNANIMFFVHSPQFPRSYGSWQAVLMYTYSEFWCWVQCFDIERLFHPDLQPFELVSSLLHNFEEQVSHFLSITTFIATAVLFIFDPFYSSFSSSSWSWSLVLGSRCPRILRRQHPTLRWSTM